MYFTLSGLRIDAGGAIVVFLVPFSIARQREKVTENEEAGVHFILGWITIKINIFSSATKNGMICVKKCGDTNKRTDEEKVP